MTFGGFGDWTQACLFSLTGNVEGKGPGRERDPLNQPAVFMNLLPYMEGAPENTGELCDAWLRYCRATWGNQEHKRTSSRKAVARALAEELSPGLRPLFLEGCGVGKNTQERAVRAVLDHGDAWGFLRHDGRLSHVECPVRIVHARDDDVIPVCQADVIAGHLPSGGDVRIYRTGLYGHSETSVENLRGQRISGAASEIVTMLAMVRELGTRPGRR